MEAESIKENETVPSNNIQCCVPRRAGLPISHPFREMQI